MKAQTYPHHIWCTKLTSSGQEAAQEAAQRRSAEGQDPPCPEDRGGRRKPCCWVFASQARLQGRIRRCHVQRHRALEEHSRRGSQFWLGLILVQTVPLPRRRLRSRGCRRSSIKRWQHRTAWTERWQHRTAWTERSLIWPHWPLPPMIPRE